MDTITSLEPKRLWHHFNEICKIPHGSGNEEGLRRYIIEFAEEHGLKYKTDTIGNIVVLKDGVGELKNAKPIVLQSHMDMVCEGAEGYTYDPAKDPIRPKIDNGWVTSGVTTLGADNGIGLAASLAICEDKSLKHGPIECLFTMTEETGLDGAFGLSKDILTGRTMINLDSEEEGLFFVGCAGGCDSILDIPVVNKELPKDLLGFKIVISGLKGGHSGLNIVDQRGNAIKILAKILYNLHTNTDVHLCDMSGGTRRNVIPSHAEAVIAIKKHKRAKVIGLIEEMKEKMKAELHSIDPDLKIEMSDVPVSTSFGLRASGKIIAFLKVLHSGVIKMSYDIPGLVQTSTNLAIVKVENEHLSVQFLSRSSSAAELESAKGKLRACAELVGASVEEPGGYPGWQPNVDSKILKLSMATYKETFGVDARYSAIHAGLECGIIGEKFPGIDMVSCGPDIKGAHSVKEKVEIRSVEKFWKLLIKVIENFAKA